MPLGAPFHGSWSNGPPDGTEVRQSVSPVRQAQQNDAADVAAICEAVQRSDMRFLPIKSLEQQSQLSAHRVRQGFVEQHPAIINRVCGSLR